MLPQSFRRLILFLLLLVLIASISGDLSRVSAGGEEWRPVDPADVALKAAVVEPNADAEAIFWDIRIDDGGQNDLVLNHFPVDTYSQIKRLFDEIHKADNHMITLKQSAPTN